jgi:hypothetical protein
MEMNTSHDQLMENGSSPEPPGEGAQEERPSNWPVVLLGCFLIAAGGAFLVVPQLYPALVSITEPGALLAGVLLTSGVRVLAGAFKPAENDDAVDSGRVVVGNVSGGSIHIVTYGEQRNDVTAKPPNGK